MALQKLSKEDSIILFDRVLLCIRKQKKGYFTLKKLRGAHGYCDWEEGIVIDYRKEFIPTLVHECIHLLEPDWSERQVMYAEKRVMNAISEGDVIHLLLLITRKL